MDDAEGRQSDEERDEGSQNIPQKVEIIKASHDDVESRDVVTHLDHLDYDNTVRHSEREKKGSDRERIEAETERRDAGGETGISSGGSSSRHRASRNHSASLRTVGAGDRWGTFGSQVIAQIHESSDSAHERKRRVTLSKNVGSSPDRKSGATKGSVTPNQDGSDAATHREKENVTPTVIVVKRPPDCSSGSDVSYMSTSSKSSKSQITPPFGRDAKNSNSNPLGSEPSQGASSQAVKSSKAKKSGGSVKGPKEKNSLSPSRASQENMKGHGKSSGVTYGSQELREMVLVTHVTTHDPPTYSDQGAPKMETLTVFPDGSKASLNIYASQIRDMTSSHFDSSRHPFVRSGNPPPTVTPIPVPIAVNETSSVGITASQDPNVNESHSTEKGILSELATFNQKFFELTCRHPKVGRGV